MNKNISENAHVPVSIGVIIDGNRRWAKERNLPILEGHRAGSENIKNFVRWADEKGVKNVIVYAFSTENWKRDEKEVSYLMNLFNDAFIQLKKEVNDMDGRISVIGEREKLSQKLQDRIAEAENDTKDNKGIHLILAISYGGRREIVRAINNILKEKKEVTEESFGNFLWTKDIPDPDLIIRTGGDRRLSNFLAWQSVYSELFFLDTYWPAFSKEEFDAVLKEYGNIERRNGR